MNATNKINLLIFMSMISFCSNNKNDFSQFKSIKMTVNSFIVKVTMIPSKFIINNVLSGDTTVTSDELQDIYKNSLCLHLSFKNKGKSCGKMFLDEKRLFAVLNTEDTIAPSAITPDFSYGIESNNFVITFNKNKLIGKKHCNLIIRTGLVSIGTLEMKIDKLLNI